MQIVNFDDGIREYAVNGDESRVIKINFSDLNLMSRVQKLTPVIEEFEQKYSEKPSPDELVNADQELRAIVNEAFGSDICTPAFGSVNILSPVGGEPLLKKFFDVFLPIIKSEIEKAASSVNVRPQVSKYLEAKAEQPTEEQSIDVSKLSAEQKAVLIKTLLS